MYNNAYFQSTIIADPDDKTRALSARNAQYLGGYPASYFLTTAQTNQRSVLEISTTNTPDTSFLIITCSDSHLNKLLVWTPANVSGTHTYQLTTAPFDLNPDASPEIEIFNNSTLKSITVLPPTGGTIISRYDYTKIAPGGTAIIKFRRKNGTAYEFLLIGALTNL